MEIVLAILIILAISVCSAACFIALHTKIIKLELTNKAHLDGMASRHDISMQVLQDSQAKVDAVLEKFGEAVKNVDNLVDNQKKIIENQRVLETHLKLIRPKGLN